MQYRLIYICLVLTKEIVSNNLTKTLSSVKKHKSFVKRTSIEDQTDFLASIKRKEDISQHLRSDSKYSEFYEFDAKVTW